MAPATVVLTGSGQYDEAQLEGYDDATIITSTKNGWSNAEVFLQVLHSVVNHVGSEDPEWKQSNPSERKPLLILVDGHSSHISLDILDFCEEQNVIMVASPAHCTHIVQILDSHQLLGAFQTVLRSEVQEMSARNQPVTNKNFGIPFTRAWNRVFTSERITNVFRDYGIHPFNPRALITGKLQQHTVLQTVDTATRLMQKGYSKAKAQAVAEKQATITEYNYTDEQHKEILEHFQLQARPDPRTEALGSVQTMVDRTILEMQMEVASRNIQAGSKGSYVTRRRKTKSLNHQAAVLTSAEHRQRLETELKEKKEASAKSAERTEYKAWHYVQKKKIIKQNEQNEPLRSEAKAGVVNARKSLQQALASLTAAENGSTRSSQVRVCMTCTLP